MDDLQLPLKKHISPNSVEIVPVKVNKGNGLMKWVSFTSDDFILAAGDEETDEDMFQVLPKTAYTFKIGDHKSIARYRMHEIEKFIHFLQLISEQCKKVDIV